jgi:hypothetical protein
MEESPTLRLRVTDFLAGHLGKSYSFNILSASSRNEFYAIAPELAPSEIRTGYLISIWYLDVGQVSVD